MNDPIRHLKQKFLSLTIGNWKPLTIFAKIPILDY